MRYVILLCGVYCCSTSIIFIKIGQTDAIALASYRLLIGGLLLLPLALRSWKRRDNYSGSRLLRQTITPAIVLGIHFISWILGGRLTTSANASLLVNMVPVAMPVLLYLIIQERINLAEAKGTLIAMTGVIALGLADFRLSPEYATGDAICFLSMLFYAWYLIHARKNRDMPSIYVYVVPVYLMAGAFCLAIAVLLNLFGRSTQWIGPDISTELVSILGLAVVPTVFGHSMINWAMTRLRGQAVAIINLAQFIFAGLMGYLLLREVPEPVFYIASALVVAGAVLIIRQPSPAE